MKQKQLTNLMVLNFNMRFGDKNSVDENTQFTGEVFNGTLPFRFNRKTCISQ